MSSEGDVVEGIRGMLVKVGLGAPTSRAFVAATLIGLGAYALKLPGPCFDEKGEMRPLKLVSSAPTATNVHFLVVPLSVATVAFLFT
jgi:hypothetical protein